MLAWLLKNLDHSLKIEKSKALKILDHKIVSLISQQINSKVLWFSDSKNLIVLLLNFAVVNANFLWPAFYFDFDFTNTLQSVTTQICQRLTQFLQQFFKQDFSQNFHSGVINKATSNLANYACCASSPLVKCLRQWSGEKHFSSFPELRALFVYFFSCLLKRTVAERKLGTEKFRDAELASFKQLFHQLELLSSIVQQKRNFLKDFLLSCRLQLTWQSHLWHRIIGTTPRRSPTEYLKVRDWDLFLESIQSFRCRKSSQLAGRS